MQRLLVIFILVLTSFVQVACHRQSENSVLLIAVEDLASTDVTCPLDGQEPSMKSGFDLLCQESVRFTHAFTPSTLAVPSMSSIMSGLYPYEHGVRHNGQTLPAKTITVAEWALVQKYRTAFFSGGAPVLRRSGVNQGFEIFDDNIIPNFDTLFRSLGKTLEAFKAWLQQEVEASPFFATLYVPDLIFTNTVTISDAGETRNLSYESQLDELNSILYDFFLYLKKNKRWDNTTIILAGLNGHTKSDRPQAATALNLHSESTQVALLIKPAQQKRDEGITWKVDKNVSLADLGPTMLELMKIPRAANAEKDFPIFSLAEFLKRPESEIPDDRFILTESGWGQWKGLSNVRSAVHKSHLLLVNDESVKIYNTLVDRWETNPLKPSDNYAGLYYSASDLLRKNNFPRWSGVNMATIAKLNLNYSHWTKAEPTAYLLKEIRSLSKRYAQDDDFINWGATFALENKDWKALKEFGQRSKNKHWIYVAEKNSGGSKLKPTDACWVLLQKTDFKSEDLKSCNDTLALHLVSWLRSDSLGLSKEAQRKKFERAYRSYRLDMYIRRNNIGTGMIWDINPEPKLKPSVVDLILNLPENQKTLALLERALRIPEPAIE